MKAPYFYSGTTTLKNKFKIKESDKLNKLERIITIKRLKELLDKKFPKEFNFNYLKSIHKYIYQDIC